MIYLIMSNIPTENRIALHIMGILLVLGITGGLGLPLIIIFYIYYFIRVSYLSSRGFYDIPHRFTEWEDKSKEAAKKWGLRDYKISRYEYDKYNSQRDEIENEFHSNLGLIVLIIFILIVALTS